MSQCQAKLGNIPSGLLEGQINSREALTSCRPMFAMAGVCRAASFRASRRSEPGCSFLPPRLLQFGQHKGKTARRFIPEVFLTQLQARDQTGPGNEAAPLQPDHGGPRCTRVSEASPPPHLVLVLLEHLSLVFGQDRSKIKVPSGGAETLVGAVRCNGEEIHPRAMLRSPLLTATPAALVSAQGAPGVS